MQEAVSLNCFEGSECGKTVVITRHGRAVARVVPAHEAEREDYAQAVARFRHRLEE